MLKIWWKVIAYLVIFFFAGYGLAYLTSGTKYDNPFIIVIGLVSLFLLLEFLSRYTKKGVQNKSHSDYHSEAYWEEVKTAVNHEWSLKYKDYLLRITNQYDNEKLYINDQLVATNKRDGWKDWIRPMHTLQSVIIEDGVEKSIKVKLGGFTSVSCKVYIDGKLYFKDKIKFSIFGPRFEKLPAEKKKDESR